MIQQALLQLPHNYLKEMKAIKIISNFIFWIVISVIAVSLIIFIIGARLKNDKTTSFFGYRWYKVVTSSMSPEILPGDVVIVKVGADDLKTDDIITFNPTADKNAALTHRLVGSSVDTDGNIIYKTKGDANKSYDVQGVNPEQIIGKVVFKIRYISRIVTYISEHLILSISVLVGFISAVYIVKRLIKFKLRSVKRKHEEVAENDYFCST